MLFFGLRCFGLLYGAQPHTNCASEHEPACASGDYAPIATTGQAGKSGEYDEHPCDERGEVERLRRASVR